MVTPSRWAESAKGLHRQARRPEANADSQMNADTTNNQQRCALGGPRALASIGMTRVGLRPVAEHHLAGSGEHGVKVVVERAVPHAERLLEVRAPVRPRSVDIGEAVFVGERPRRKNLP